MSDLNPRGAASRALVVFSRVPLRFNPALFPPNGWVFHYAGLDFKGGSRAELTQKVAFWFSSNGIPRDAASEIEAQLCSNHPGYCREEEPSPEDQETLVARRQEYLSGKFHSVLQAKPSENPFAAQGVVSARSAICSACQFNVSDPRGCSSCVTASAATRAQILTRAKLTGIKTGTCAFHGVDLPVAVRLSEQKRRGEAVSPSNCWRK